jgi:hypothetical protein
MYTCLRPGCYALAHSPSAPAGHYWGSISTGCTCESVEASDLVIAVGCAWTDYSTLGYSLLLQPSKVVTVGTDRVTIKGGETYGCIDMEVRGWDEWVVWASKPCQLGGAAADCQAVSSGLSQGHTKGGGRHMDALAWR